jgi:soluble lytic murein transglycosylase
MHDSNSPILVARSILIAALAGSAAVTLGASCGRVDARRAASGEAVVAPPWASEPDPAVRAADSALAQGRPWRATQLIAPALADSVRRTPGVLLLAATAAGEWEGWPQVRKLLAGEPWLDTLFAGQGRALLARAALGEGVARGDTLAITQAELAVRSAPDEHERGVRLVLLARALDRLDQRDSAAATYARAAQRLPDVADWLHLRAAGATADSAGRAAWFVGLRTEVARARAERVDAAARERVGDFAGAARVYATLDARAAVLRVRLAATGDSASAGGATGDSAGDSAVGDSASRVEVRRALVALVDSRSGSQDARAAADLLDRAFAPLTAAEQLAVARSAAVAGPSVRAASGFAAALGEGIGTSRDRFTYATVLSRLGRDAEAAAQFARVTEPAALASGAAYQRARSLLRDGRVRDATAALRALLGAAPGDTDAASSALFLLGDLAVDDGRDTDARAAFREIGRRYPTAANAAGARFRAAIIALAADSARQAALELDTLAIRYPKSDEALASLYWSGRAWERSGDVERARARWREAAARQPLSYYAMLGAWRLGEAPWAPAAVADRPRRVAAVDSAMRRTDLLVRLGMDAEAQYEYDRLARDADQSTDRMLATAAAFRDRGLSSGAIRLAQRALDRKAPPDAAVYRLVYPVSYADVLSAESAERELDRALVAALIRQESNFTAHATSPAGARGLMQVMPAVGKGIAAALDFPVWDPVLLYQPDVNMQLGTAHLAGVLERYDHPALALAAYNAGGSRVERWRTRAGTDDWELFVERIPYRETRDYVRIILRNRELYRALYGW